MKVSIYFLSLLFLFSCQENDIKESTKTSKPSSSKPNVTQPVCEEAPTVEPICEEPEGMVAASSIEFTGVKEVTRVSQRRALVSWDLPTGDVNKFYVFLVDRNGVKSHHKTIAADRAQLWLSNLDPNTTYRVQVNLMDNQGRMDSNQNVVQFTTTDYESFANAKSIELGSGNSFSGKKSNQILRRNDAATISIWFKTDYNTPRESRIVNFYAANEGQSSINLAVDRDKVFMGYRNADNDYFRIEHTVNYYQNEWHHLAGTYDGQTYKLFLDGQLVQSKNDTFAGHGEAPLTVGVYANNDNLRWAFRGQIDELSVWHEALTEAQVTALATQTSDLRLHPEHQSLRGWWRMGDHQNDNANRVRSWKGGGNLTLRNGDINQYKSDAP